MHFYSISKSCYIKYNTQLNFFDIKNEISDNFSERFVKSLISD